MEHKDNQSQKSFEQQYQQHIAGITNETQISNYGHTSLQQIPSKKSGKKRMMTFVVIVILIFATATVFTYRDTLKNTLFMMIKSPADYYAQIEKDAILKHLKELKPYTKNNNKNKAYHITADATYDKNSVNSLMRNYMKFDLNFLKDYFGIAIDNIGLDMTIALQENQFYNSTDLNLNHVKIMTAQIFGDLLQKEMLIRLPDLSPAYLRMATESNADNTKTNTISSKDLLDLLQRYGKLIAKQINDVTLKKNVTRTSNELTIKCNKLIITIDQDAWKEILTSILTEAKDDKVILSLLPKYQVDQKEYLNEIEEMLISLDNNKTSLVMNVYVSNNGNIIGRELVVNEENNTVATFAYTNLQKGNLSACEFDLVSKDVNSDDNSLKGTIHYANNKGTYDGKATIELNNVSSVLPSNLVFDIDFENVHSVKKDSQTYHYGTYTISSLSFFGIQFEIENNVNDNKQENALTIRMGSTTLFTLDTTSEYLKDYSIEKPSDLSEIYDINDRAYLKTIDIKAFLSQLSKNLGIDTKSLMMKLLLNLIKF